MYTVYSFGFVFTYHSDGVLVHNAVDLLHKVLPGGERCQH